MGEAEWVLVGVIVGLLAGIPIGWLISQVISKTTGSVVFDRDEQGRIVAIHYAGGAR